MAESKKTAADERAPEDEAPAPRRRAPAERPATETQVGGRYEVNGRMVDAEGRPLKD